MINADMRAYNFFTLGGLDDYGQPTTSNEPSGVIKMAINITSQATQDNIMYKDCNYIGLTMDKDINDTYIIDYDNKKLKVLYINPKSRFKQVFMSDML